MIGFATSGTTGPPVTWLHSQAQLDAEVRVLRQVWDDREWENTWWPTGLSQQEGVAAGGVT